MDTIALPSGTASVKFAVVTHLVAKALCPQTDCHDTCPNYAAAHGRIERQLSRAVELGDLQVLDPLTLAIHPYPVGDALRDAVIRVDDLRDYTERHGLPAIFTGVGAGTRRVRENRVSA